MEKCEKPPEEPGKLRQFLAAMVGKLEERKGLFFLPRGAEIYLACAMRVMSSNRQLNSNAM